MSGVFVKVSGAWGVTPGQIAAKQQETANQLAALAAALMVEQILANDQFDSGALVNSPYVATSAGSGYSQAAAAARGRDPSVQLQDDIGPSAAGHADVALAVSHADPQNYGTTVLPARPFFEPALERVDDQLEAALAKAWEELFP